MILVNESLRSLTNTQINIFFKFIDSLAMIHNKRRKTSRSGSDHPEEKNKNRNKGGGSGSDRRTDRDRGEETLCKTILSDRAEGEETQTQTQTLTGVYNNTDFCIAVASNVMLKRVVEGINFAISPLCLRLGLSLVAKGSSGDTLNQLLSLLGLKTAEELDLQTCHMLAHLSDHDHDHDHDHGPFVSFINGAWIRKGLTFKPSFKAAANGVFKAQTQEVDFQTRADQIIQEINSWAENATKGLIKHLVPSGSIDRRRTRLVLANALYFKGTWKHTFDESLLDEFHLLNRQVIKVPFLMRNYFRCGTYLYGSFEGYEVVSVPYKTSGEDTRKFSMYILLPQEKYGLPNLLQKVFSNPKVALNQQLEPCKLDLWIPSFDFTFEFEASETMKQLGLVLPFVDGGIDDMVSTNITLSNIFHKSYIQVNEKGTKAAASTSFSICLSAARGQSLPKTIVADHPFMFFIREETSGTVFMTGAVLNPLKE